MFNLYNFVEEINEKGNVSAVVHAVTTLFWTFEFVPTTIRLIAELAKPWSTPPPTSAELQNNEAYHMAAITYGIYRSEEEILDWLKHESMLYRADVVNNAEHVTHVIVTADNDGDIWFGIRGVDMTSFTSVGAIGCPYYVDMTKYGLEGKVISSFVPALFKEAKFHEMVETSQCEHVNVCGHSMGSCMAIVIGAYIAKQRPDVKVFVSAFAPLMFYDETFRECLLQIPNLELKMYLNEYDVLAKLYSTLRITDKNEYKDFNLVEKCFPYYDSLGYVRDVMPVKELTLFDVLNPVYYERHGIWCYGNLALS